MGAAAPTLFFGKAVLHPFFKICQNLEVAPQIDKIYLYNIHALTSEDTVVCFLLLFHFLVLKKCIACIANKRKNQCICTISLRIMISKLSVIYGNQQEILDINDIIQTRNALFAESLLDKDSQATHNLWKPAEIIDLIWAIILIRAT